MTNSGTSTVEAMERFLTSEFGRWLVTTLVAVVGLVVASVGLLVARGQARLAGQKFRFDLFERRYPIYAACQRVIDAADDIKDVGDSRIFEFRAAMRDVEMFFLDDVVSYVRAIDERVGKAALAQAHLARSRLNESERGDLLDKWNGHVQWLLETQKTELQAKFRPYLKFSSWK